MSSGSLPFLKQLLKKESYLGFNVISEGNLTFFLFSIKVALVNILTKTIVKNCTHLQILVDLFSSDDEPNKISKNKAGC